MELTRDILESLLRDSAVQEMNGTILMYKAQGAQEALRHLIDQLDKADSSASEPPRVVPASE